MKKRIKVCIVVSLVLLAFLIIIPIYIKQYPKKLVDADYNKKSFGFILSNEDCLEKLKSYKNIKKVADVLLFIPNEEYDTIVHEDYVLYKDGEVVSSKITGADTKLNWEEIMVRNPYGKYLLVQPASRYNVSLNDDEVSILVQSDIYEQFKEKILEVNGKKIGFYYNDNALEYIINGYYISKVPGILISDNNYQTLSNNKTKYSYIVEYSGLKESYSIKDKLEKKNIIVINENTYDQKYVEMVDQIDTLETLNKFILITTSILVLFILTDLFKIKK